MIEKQVVKVIGTEHIPEVGDVIRFGVWTMTPFVNACGNTMMRITHVVHGNAIELWDESNGWFRLGDGREHSRDVQSSEYKKHQDK